MSNISYVLKQNKIVRLAALPVVNMIRFSRKVLYRFTDDAKEIRAYKDIHLGERCFIIGNGPSLTMEDLNCLKNEHCFAANRICNAFSKTDWRPEYYMCVDSSVFKDMKDTIGELDIPNIFLTLECKKYRLHEKNKNIRYINNYYPYLVNQYKRVNGIKVSPDVSKFFVAGETVTFNAIQFAIYMGFKEIYLLGVDHKYSRCRDASGTINIDVRIKDYFDEEPSKNYNVQNVQTSTAAYIAAKAYCEEHDIVIKNLTRGGALEVFQRANFDSILQKG